MKQRLQKFGQKIKNLSFYKKKPFYVVLIVLLSLLIVADVAVAALLPTQTMSMGRQNMEFSGSFGDMTELPDGVEAESADSTEEAADGDGDAEEESGAASEDGAGQGFGGGAPGDGEMPSMDSDAEMPSMEADAELPSADSDAEAESAEADSGEWSGRQDRSDMNTTQTGGVFAFLQTVKSHWLPILIVLLLLDALCIFMLVRISRRERKAALEAARAQAQADGEVHLVRPVKKKKHSHYLWIIPLVGMALLVLVVKSLSAQSSEESAETEATVHSGTAELSDISTVVPGTGTLTEEESEDLELPEEVEIEEWYVSDGDTVEEGDTLAKVDTVSVMTAITSIQEQIDALDEELAEHEDEEISDEITASADGRVMAIYAEEDVSVTDTMYENAALMRISLDGALAVSFETEVLSSGETVEVVLSDGTEVDGKVESVIDGTAVVTISDEDGELDDSVLVYTEDGELAGEGTLYIHSELKITGFSGTVEDIEVSVGDGVEAGDTLLTLTDTDYEGEYEALLAQRTELTDEMQELFVLYQDQYIYASCAGVISGLGSTSSSTETDSASTEDDTDSDTDDTSDTDADSDADTDSEADTSTGSDTDTDEDGDTASSNSQNMVTTMKSTAGSAVSEKSMSAVSAVYTSSSVTVCTVNSVAETSAEETSAVEETTEEAVDAVAETDSEAETMTAEETIEEAAETESSEEETSTEAESSEEETEAVTEPTAESGYANYVGVISAMKNSTLVLFLQPEACDISDYSDLSDIDLSEDTMTEVLTLKLSDSALLFAYTEDSWTTLSASDLSVGDILILTYDSEDEDSRSLVWIVQAESAEMENDAAQESQEDMAGENQTGEETGTENLTGGSESLGNGSDVSGMNAAQTQSGTASMADYAQSGTASMDSSALSGGTTDVTAEAEETTTEEAVESTYGIAETTWLSVTPQDTMTITITVDEMDILSLEVGQTAQVTLSALPGQSFEGEVTAIDVSGTNSGGSTKYTAEITIAREEDMLAGMNSSVVITISTEEDVLTIPEAALVEEDGSVYVYTTYDEETDTLGGLTEVTTGVSDGENVEILDGLSEGGAYYYSYLDVVNYSSSTVSSTTGSFSFSSLFGSSGGGRSGGR
ncbi:MAG: HlyD family efflux transporter periplasmic adaptor subunit [Lachnospiraceae bacterium]|nr:HlyD family efflux transporter periplasmic adaptor subunit [Lachnospiraceae bacterium]